MTTAFLLLMSGSDNPTAGASPGPRYVVPAPSLLAGGVARSWERLPVTGSPWGVLPPLLLDGALTVWLLGREGVSARLHRP